jgi:uncharacterized membrane protein
MAENGGSGDETASELTRLARAIRREDDSRDELASAVEGLKPDDLRTVGQALLGSGEAAGGLEELFLSESYKGKFPHPDVLKSLDECVEGGAERAFSMTEKEQKHRHGIDDMLVAAQIRLIDSQVRKSDSDTWDRRLVIILSFVIVVVALVAAYKTAMAGHAIGAGAIGGGAGILVALIALFNRPKSAGKPPEDSKSS